MSKAYDEARAGGRRSGFLAQLPSMGDRQRRKSAQSYQDQIQLHLDKIASPQNYVLGWFGLRDSHRASLLQAWRKEVVDHQEQIEILKGFEDDCR